MNQNKKISVGKVLLLISPILTFFVLLIPYSFVNQRFIGEWLGCGCPKFDELGNVIPTFNANDFTTLFWLVIALLVTLLSVFLSKKLPKDKRWLRILYIVFMFVLSILIAFKFRQMMLWN